MRLKPMETVIRKQNLNVLSQVFFCGVTISGHIPAIKTKLILVLYLSSDIQKENTVYNLVSLKTSFLLFPGLPYGPPCSLLALVS